MRNRFVAAVLIAACGPSAALIDPSDMMVTTPPQQPPAPPPQPPAPPPSTMPPPVNPPADAGAPGTFPLLLGPGRTYDQQRNYLAWSGPVSFVTLTHRDDTSLPAAEGGAACAGTCTEQVTRLEAGASVSGRFAMLETFNVQVAREPGAGRAVIEACGQTLAQPVLDGSGTAGFNNYPVPAWAVPTDGPCTWKVSAVGGFVDFRAVTVAFRHAGAPPKVDVKVNGSDGPVELAAPARYTVSWSSDGVCEAFGAWAGVPAAQGTSEHDAVSPERSVYGITCRNQAGTTTDQVEVNVLQIQ